MEKNIFSKIYMWVFVGLIITFGSGYLLSTTPSLLYLVFGTGAYWAIFIAELAIAIILPFRLHKMSKTTSIILYILYTVLTGLTFGSIFLMYELSSILYVFLVAALVFLVFALIGRFTSIDLSKLGIVLLMALLGIIILTFLNMFIGNESLDLMLCVIGLLVFFIYIAYDIQKIKRLDASGMDQDKLAIFGAFELFLDFINIFLRLIQLMGKRKD